MLIRCCHRLLSPGTLPLLSCYHRPLQISVVMMFDSVDGLRLVEVRFFYRCDHCKLLAQVEGSGLFLYKTTEGYLADLVSTPPSIGSASSPSNQLWPGGAHWVVHRHSLCCQTQTHLLWKIYYQEIVNTCILYLNITLGRSHHFPHFGGTNVLKYRVRKIWALVLSPLAKAPMSSPRCSQAGTHHWYCRLSGMCCFRIMAPLPPMTKSTSSHIP